MLIFGCVQVQFFLKDSRQEEHLFAKSNPNLDRCCRYSVFIKGKQSRASSYTEHTVAGRRMV